MITFLSYNWLSSNSFNLNRKVLLKMLSFLAEKGGPKTQKVAKNADFSGTTQNLPKLLGQTQSRD